MRHETVRDQAHRPAVGGEITRACDADRERYLMHLPGLHARGYITQAQWDEMSDKVLAATDLAELDKLLYGLPKPARAPRRWRDRDWGIPRNFVPAVVAAGFAGLLLTTVPATVLTGHGIPAKVTVLVSALAGSMILGVTLVLMTVAACCWAEKGAEEKKRRLLRDQRGW